MHSFKQKARTKTIDTMGQIKQIYIIYFWTQPLSVTRSLMEHNCIAQSMSEKYLVLWCVVQHGKVALTVSIVN